MQGLSYHFKKTAKARESLHTLNKKEHIGSLGIDINVYQIPDSQILTPTQILNLMPFVK